ncbi:MAG: hypothetical protein ABSF29_13305 [Tepidisphaeraceae bacterium]|jgi:hypothetical protein
MNGSQPDFGQQGLPQQPPRPVVPMTAQPIRSPQPMVIPQHPPHAAPVHPHAHKPAHHAGEEPIDLVAEETSSPETTKSKIRAFSVAEAHIGAHEWKRTPNDNHGGACRVRSFHGRLSDQGMEYLDNAINEWLDKHPEADVKFVTSTVGMFDGKIKDFALILNVWY